MERAEWEQSRKRPAAKKMPMPKKMPESLQRCPQIRVMNQMWSGYMLCMFVFLYVGHHRLVGDILIIGVYCYLQERTSKNLAKEFRAVVQLSFKIIFPVGNGPVMP